MKKLWLLGAVVILILTSGAGTASVADDQTVSGERGYILPYNED